MPGGINGNGSLSSGSSIVTISSDAVLDPDGERRKDADGGGDGIRNEKWYHTILQVSVPFFIAGLGTIGAGRVLTIAKVRALPEEDAALAKGRLEYRNRPTLIFFSPNLFPTLFFYIYSEDRETVGYRKLIGDGVEIDVL